jgi:hypothetical protein
MFGLSREERADRICAGFQREIFENSLSLAVPLAAEERPWSDETTIWKLAELVAFFLHCLGRYTIRGPDLRFRERVQMETGYAEFAAMIPVSGSAYTYAYATLGEQCAVLREVFGEYREPVAV